MPTFDPYYIISCNPDEASITLMLTNHVTSLSTQNWYECQLQLINDWLGQRPAFSLHIEQQHALAAIMKVQSDRLTNQALILHQFHVNHLVDFLSSPIAVFPRS